MVHNPAVILALVEKLCPSANGACAQRLAEAIEVTSETGIDQSFTLSSTNRDWIHAGLEASAGRVAHWAAELERLSAIGIQFVTIADAAYPAMLMMVHDAPPFLFVRGHLGEGDNRAVAIVGTRRASDKGLNVARRLAAQLSKHHITIVSGMAAGIDTAAHEATLDAEGRTIAVFGTGIEKLYPKNAGSLAGRISDSGACVSQFLPAQEPQRWTFPVRNIVTSGLAVGTVVVEASETSGARLQAKNALAHGKRLFLVKSLVEAQPWARELIGHPGVTATDDVDEIAEAVSHDVFAVAEEQGAEPAAM